MILYPLQIDDEGGLLYSNDPLDLVSSELKALLDTAIYSRVFRMDYGTPTYLLQKLELGQLLTDLNTKLAASGFTGVSVGSASTLADLQSGIIKLTVKYRVGSSIELAYYDIELNSLAQQQ